MYSDRHCNRCATRLGAEKTVLGSNPRGSAVPGGLLLGHRRRRRRRRLCQDTLVTHPRIRFPPQPARQRGYVDRYISMSGRRWQYLYRPSIYVGHFQLPAPVPARGQFINKYIADFNQYYITTLNSLCSFLCACPFLQDVFLIPYLCSLRLHRCQYVYRRPNNQPVSRFSVSCSHVLPDYILRLELWSFLATDDSRYKNIV